MQDHGLSPLSLGDNDAQLFAQYARSGSDRVTASTAPLRFRDRKSGVQGKKLETIFMRFRGPTTLKDRIENYLRASKGFVDGYPFEGAHFNYRDRERWRRLRIPGEERRACLELLYAGSRAIAALIGRQRRPIIRSIRTLRIRQGHGLDGSTAVSRSEERRAGKETRNHFHEVSRTNNPKGQDRKLLARKQRLCRRVPFRGGTLQLPRSRTMASSSYSWRGAESVPRVALCRITGYRRSHWETTTPNYSLNTHAPDQTGSRPRRLHCGFDLAAPG